MARNKPSQLGYLMDLLGISAAELAEYLNTDRTNVSKWKTGTRPFSRTSSYYERVVRYLIEKNTNLVGGVLQDFFKSIYKSDITDEENYIPICIRRFLNNSEVAEAAKAILNDSNESLYSASFTVYRGANGRQAAFMRMLDVADAQPEPCEIHILEIDQFEWAIQDMSFFNTMIERLKKLLNNGHKIKIIHLFAKNYHGYSMVLRQFSALIFHKNIRQYILSYEYSKRLAFCIFTIKDKLLIKGTGMRSSLKELYTSMFTDKLTISHMSAMFDECLNVVKPIFIAEKAADINRIIKTIEQGSNNEPMYFSGAMASIMTMSHELITEILDQNNLSAAERISCIRARNILLNFVKNTDGNTAGGQFFSEVSIKEPLVYDKIVHYGMSSFTSVPVIVTRDQYLRHLNDTADFIDTYRQFNIALNPVVRDYDTLAFGWFKKNTWAFAGNKRMDGSENKLMFFEDQTLINQFTDVYDEIYLNTPSEYRDHAKVAEIFRNIVRKMR